MRANVFTDAGLGRHAGRFVWLSIDAERPQNAAFAERFPAEAYPTLLVIDPATEQPAFRWLGSATVPQLERMLSDADRAVRGGTLGLEARLATADRLFAGGDAQKAAEALEALLKDAPPEWPSRGRAVETALYSLQKLDRNEECARLAGSELGRLGPTPSYANCAATGLYCALGLPKDAQGRAPAIASFEAAAKDALQKQIAMAVDDRSGLYEALVEARDDGGDEKGGAEVAGQWAGYLEAEAAKAATPEQRAVYDSHRFSAYLRLGQPERAIPMLQQSERELPGDYNPPARLCAAYRLSKKYEDALAACDRALAKAYGPRKLRVYSDRAEALIGLGKPELAKGTLEEALAFSAQLPEAQRSKRLVEGLKKRLAALQR